jgi:hypothetical protein
MKFNAEQITEHFKQVTAGEMTDTDYADICRRYAQATIHMVKLRSFVRGSNHGHQA